MRFSLEQLRVFVTAAHSGSFSAAARKLGKAQSVISSSVQNLELDLGLCLFDRSGRYPQLTAEGKALLEEAEFVLQRAERLGHLAQSMLGGQESHLRLAIDEQVVQAELAGVLVELQQQFPLLSLELLHPVAEEVLELLTQQRVDLGLTFQAPGRLPAGVEAKPVGSVAMQCVVGPGHPLIGQPDVEIQQLASYPQLLVKSRNGDLNTDFRVSSQLWTTESIGSAIALVAEGPWWCVLPQSSVRKMTTQSRLHVLPVTTELGCWYQPIELLFRTDKIPGSAMRWLLERLEALFKQPRADG